MFAEQHVHKTSPSNGPISRKCDEEPPSHEVTDEPSKDKAAEEQGGRAKLDQPPWLLKRLAH